MITSERALSVKVRIFTESIQELDDVLRNINHDLKEVVKHHAKEYEEAEGVKIQVILVPDPICAHCHKPYNECQCGRPRVRPL